MCCVCACYSFRYLLILQELEKRASALQRQTNLLKRYQAKFGIIEGGDATKEMAKGGNKENDKCEIVRENLHNSS
jgi:hypothetical protein